MPGRHLESGSLAPGAFAATTRWTPNGVDENKGPTLAPNSLPIVTTLTPHRETPCDNSPAMIEIAARFRYLLTHDAFAICPMLNVTEFISFCADRGIHTNTEQLERFERLGILIYRAD
jgi:hypothetical protein